MSTLCFKEIKVLPFSQTESSLYFVSYTKAVVTFTSTSSDIKERLHTYIYSIQITQSIVRTALFQIFRRPQLTNSLTTRSTLAMNPELLVISSESLICSFFLHGQKVPSCSCIKTLLMKHHTTVELFVVSFKVLASLIITCDKLDS